jgi:hypothetical protein
MATRIPATTSPGVVVCHDSPIDTKHSNLFGRPDIAPITHPATRTALAPEHTLRGNAPEVGFSDALQKGLLGCPASAAGQVDTKSP